MTTQHKSNIIDARARFASRMVIALKGRMTAANINHSEAIEICAQLKVARDLILAEREKVQS